MKQWMILFRVLRPTKLFAITLPLILLFQFIFFTELTVELSQGESETVVRYGLGAPVIVTTIDTVTSYSWNRMVLVVNLFATCCLANLLARAWATSPNLRRRAKPFWVTAAVIVIVSLLASIGFSKYYWGYYFFRPPVLSETHDVASITTITPVLAEWNGENIGTQRTLKLREEYSLIDKVRSCEEDPYYCLEERLLLGLESAGRLPSEYTTDQSALSLFPVLLEKSGLRVQPKEGYTDSDPYGGILIEALDNTGDRILFVGAVGGRVSDDHLSYYELLFKWRDDTSNWVYVRGQQFFYDSAGIEGLEWYAAWFALSISGIALAFALFVLWWTALWLLGRLRRPQSAQCPTSIESDDLE